MPGTPRHPAPPPLPLWACLMLAAGTLGTLALTALAAALGLDLAAAALAWMDNRS